MHCLSRIFKKISGSLPSWKYLLLGLLLCAGYSFAADVNNDSDAIRMIVQVLNLVFTIITFLLTPAIVLAGWLLSPDWTMGDFFGLRPYFINVWVLVSNLVYIIFAMMLLWMAVMQIFSSESNYAFKKKLPRFLVGIMIVPFTWLIVSWTLSFANQAVAAVLSIPMGAISSLQGTDEEKSFFHNRVIPTKFVLDFAQDAPAASAESVGCTDNGETADGTKCISPAEFVTYNQSGPFFIIMIYAYDIFKIQNTETVNFSSVCGASDGSTADAESCISSIGKLLSKFGVAFITTLFFAIILIALCWVLLARAFKLWIYVMFSPLFGLAYAVSDEGLGKTLQSE